MCRAEVPMKHRPKTYTSTSTRIAPALLLLCQVLSGCGFSEQINNSIGSQERSLESEAARQVLQQSDVIVSKAHEILPDSDVPVVIAVPHTQCLVQLTHTATDVSLQLTTPECTIETPKEAQQVGLAMSLSDLSFSA